MQIFGHFRQYIKTGVTELWDTIVGGGHSLSTVLLVSFFTVLAFQTRIYETSYSDFIPNLKFGNFTSNFSDSSG